MNVAVQDLIAFITSLFTTGKGVISYTSPAEKFGVAGENFEAVESASLTVTKVA